MRGTTLPIAALAAILFAAGCGDGPAPTESSADRAPGARAGADAGAAAAAAAPPASVLRDLAAARAATARFRRFDVAYDAGYDFLFMDMCMVDESGAGRGGMGFHWVDTGLLDAELDVTRPEALLYEPLPNGGLRLVGLEYVIPAEAWTSPNPPELFGRPLVLNQFDLWALHVWIWKANPSGIFADWNPRVDCEHAGAAHAGAAHADAAHASEGRVR